MIAQLSACVLVYDIVQMDETRIQVLKETGRSASSHSYIRVQRGGPPHQPVVLFHYDPTRGRAVAAELLEGFGGYLRSDGFEVFAAFDDGRLAIDDNACERVIRPFVIGRRNWLFADTPNGAEVSATLYSFNETAKADGHEPYRHLRHLFTELPKASSPEQVSQLLPLNTAPQDIPAP